MTNVDYLKETKSWGSLRNLSEDQIKRMEEVLNLDPQEIKYQDFLSDKTQLERAIEFELSLFAQKYKINLESFRIDSGKNLYNGDCILVNISI